MRINKVNIKYCYDKIKKLLETALREYVDVRKRNNIKDLRGKITFKSDYDYKAMRN